MSDSGPAALLHVLQHSLGLDRFGQGRAYRNHFVTGEGSDDYPICMTLVEAGMMSVRVGNELSGGDYIFRVTDAGRTHVRVFSPAPPKLTRAEQRYKLWLELDSSLTFGEFIKRRKYA